jgi:hypothetical protein
MTRRPLPALLALSVLTVGAGCTVEYEEIDAGAVDARPTLDAPRPDAPTADAPSAADTRVPPDAPMIDSGVDGGMPDTPIACPDGLLEGMEGQPVISGSTSGASATATASCAGKEPSPARFYSWIAPRDGTYLITTAGSVFDTALVLRAGDTCTGAELDCSDDTDLDLTSRIAVTTTAGTHYVIVVTGFDGAESGAFDLHIYEGIGSEAGLCGDGVDDDADGSTDCDDFDCDGDPACGEDCSDGVDNNGDGDVDCDDFRCYEVPPCFEANCTNGADDDADGDIDCEDFDCEFDSACS